MSQKAPLAERFRPKNIDDIIGQEHLVGKDGPIRKFIQNKDIPSMIFWGPPGVGKTTFAMLLADSFEYTFYRISAVDAGVKDLRKIIDQALLEKNYNRKTILFVDEIHRFNKSQQDSLLHAVENGTIVLIGATTENPSFEVNSALLSRCRVYRLRDLSDEDIEKLLLKAIKEDELISKFDIELNDIDFLVKISGGDARAALTSLEISLRYAYNKSSNKIVLNKDLYEIALQQKTANYDKHGEQHYDTISAFIKSMRGSDPNAAIFWLAKMLESGEDPKFIARRMVIFASEDIGNADPTALLVAVNVFQAVTFIGMPEARINLAQAATYLASTVKSNASYMAIDKALQDIRQGAIQTVPLHLRNAPTKLMKSEGYGANYKYPHDFPNQFVPENYFPEDFEKQQYYVPNPIGKEAELKQRLDDLWGGE